MECTVLLSRGGASRGYGKLSRRQHEALGANAVFLARVGSHERLLNLDEVEGDQALLLSALTTVRRFRLHATIKTKWLSEVPCIFSLASRPETTQEILRQDRASEADAHHPLTCAPWTGLLAGRAIVQRIAKQGWSKCAHPHLRYPGFWLPRGCTRTSNGLGPGWRTKIQNAAAFDFEWTNAKRIAQLRQRQNGHRPVVNKWTTVFSA